MVNESDSLIIALMPAASGCNGYRQLSLRYGMLDDGCNGQYYDYMDCAWLIAPGQGRITLSFTRFDTELDYDFVNVYDGRDGPLIGTYSGHSLPPTIISTGSSLHVTFHSDSGVRGTGFHAVYSTEGI